MVFIPIVVISVVLVGALVFFAFFPIRPSWFFSRVRRTKQSKRSRYRPTYQTPSYYDPDDDYDYDDREL